MKNTISIKGKELKINNSFPIVFEEEIEVIIDMEDVVIVMTVPADGYVTVNRVYGVREGKIAWRVQDMTEYDPGYAYFAPDPYSGIRVYEEDPSIVIATTWYGFRFLIDPETGKIVGRESWVK